MTRRNFDATGFCSFNGVEHVSQYASAQDNVVTNFSKGALTIGARLSNLGNKNVNQAIDDRHLAAGWRVCGIKLPKQSQADKAMTELVKRGVMTYKEQQDCISAFEDVYFHRQCPDMNIIDETIGKYPNLSRPLTLIKRVLGC